MPILPRAAINALFPLCATGLAILVLAGISTPAYAEAPARAPAVPATLSPTPGPSGSPDPATLAPTTLAPTMPAPGGSVMPGTPASPAPSVPPPSSGPGSAPGDGSGGCGLFDVACKAGEAINEWLAGVVKSAVPLVFGLMGKTVLGTPRLDQIPRVSGLWDGSLAVANSCLVLLVVIGGVLIMGHQTLQTSYTVKDIAPRLVIGVVAANFSLPLIGQAIVFANALSAALLGGVSPSEASGLLEKILSHVLSVNPGDVGIFVVLLVGWVVVLGTIFTFMWVIRIMLTILLIAAAPLALACHALPQTEGLAKLWWRAMAGVLAIQVAQSLVFITAMKIFFTTDPVTTFGLRGPNRQFDLWIMACLLYVLIRIPSWISKMIWRGGLSGSPITRAVRTIAAILIFRGTAGKIGGSHAAATTPRRPPIPATPAQHRQLPPPPPPSDLPGWIQPDLPFPPTSPHGTQLPLPLNPPPQPRTPQPNWTQLRLPDKTAAPPRWQQTALPIRPRYTQTRLPAPPPRRHVQPELPLSFPPPGTPAAGRSPRRTADEAALRDAQARARQRHRT